MSVYIFAPIKEYVLADLDYTQTYKQHRLREVSQPVRYVCAELPDQENVEFYRRVGIDAEQILSMHQYFTDNHTLILSVKAEDKLEELKNSLHYTGVDYRGFEIWLIKDGYVIASILLDEENRDYIRKIYYYSYAKLVRVEIYMDGIIYIEYFRTARSEDGLYAKLMRRSFLNRNGSIAFEQIFEKEREWYLFSDGRRYTRLQFMVRFINKLNLTEQDIVILDSFVSNAFMQAVFSFGKAARIVAVVHAQNSFNKSENLYKLYLNEFPYYWFQYSEMLDTMIVSSKLEKEMVTKELERYHCNIPDIKVVPIEGKFTYAVIHESYGGNLALSWSFKGKTDGFWIHDESGKRICETRNVHQHYFLIKGYGRENGFVIKAFVDTVKGKLVIAESELIYLCTRRYEKPAVSLVIPVYNAEDYIIRTLDNALAQSLLGLEIIAVDDGCKDSTPDILGWYAEKYSNVEVVHKENGGVAAARNTGIEAAKGEYIGFMDNDDMIHPDMMKKLYDSAKKNDCDIAVTSVYIIQNDGYKIWLQYQMEEDKAVSVEKFFHMHYVHSCTHGLVLWNKLYRTSIVKLHALPSLMGDEDVAWTPYILSHASRICYLNGYFYEWDRIIRDSTLGMKLGKKTKEECVRSYKEAIMFYLRNGNPQKIELLKEVAMTQLFTLSAWYAYPEFEELRKQINETF